MFASFCVSPSAEVPFGGHVFITPPLSTSTLQAAIFIAFSPFFFCPVDLGLLHVVLERGGVVGV